MPAYTAVRAAAAARHPSWLPESGGRRDPEDLASEESRRFPYTATRPEPEASARASPAQKHLRSYPGRRKGSCRNLETQRAKRYSVPSTLQSEAREQTVSPPWTRLWRNS